MREFAGFLAVAVLGGAISMGFYVLNRALGRGDADHSRPGTYSIRPSRPFILTYTVLSSAMAGFGFWGIAQDLTLWPAWFLAALFSFGAVGMLFGFPTDYTVSWDDKGISGPRSVTFPPFGRKRAFIAWGGIVEVRAGGNLSWSARDASGHRIAWSEGYAGWQRLNEEMSRRRPDLMRNHKRR